MKKATKIWLITAIALVCAGIAVFVGGMAMLHWDLSRLSDTKYTTETIKITKSFKDLSINTKSDDVAFVLSEDQTCRVVFYEQENMKHTAEVNNDTLEIGVRDTREWYEHIGLFTSGSPKITVYLPQKSYAALVINALSSDIEIPDDFTFDSIAVEGSTGNISCGASAKGKIAVTLTTGDIRLSGAEAEALDLSVTTGDIRLSGVTAKGDITIGVSTGITELAKVGCKNLLTEGSTGNVSMKNVIASGALSVGRSTGDVLFDGCDASEISVRTNTGDVRGTLLSEKVFLTDTATGSVSVPKTLTGGKCEITTTTGDISIEISDKTKN